MPPASDGAPAGGLHHPAEAAADDHRPGFGERPSDPLRDPIGRVVRLAGADDPDVERPGRQAGTSSSAATQPRPAT